MGAEYEVHTVSRLLAAVAEESPKLLREPDRLAARMADRLAGAGLITPPEVTAELEDLRARVAELERAQREIRALHTDSVIGPCPTCFDADDYVAGGDGLVPWPCPTARLAGAEPCDPPHTRGER